MPGHPGSAVNERESVTLAEARIQYTDTQAGGLDSSLRWNDIVAIRQQA